MELSICSAIFFLVSIANFVAFGSSDSDPLHDTCPATSQPKQAVFINGLPCKNPSNITASDFKSLKVSLKGDTDNQFSSSMNIVTAKDFPGLNTLGLSLARTDLDVDGMAMPHLHPRASEMLFVDQGVVLAGFIDTKNNLFQSILKEGDVFVIPRGLVHFSLNFGFEAASVFSVLNSQNPGVVSIVDAMFEPSAAVVSELVQRLHSLSASTIHGNGNGNGSSTFANFSGF